MTGDDPIVLRIDKLRPCPNENASEIVMIPMTDSVDVDYSTTFCTDNEWDSQSFSTSSLSDRSSDCELPEDTSENTQNSSLSKDQCLTIGILGTLFLLFLRFVFRK